MAWRVNDVECVRKEFIKRCLLDLMNFSNLCQEYGISRTTGYKWLDRYHEGGIKNLTDRPRRPKNRPNDTAPEVVKLIIETRERFQHWGAKKIIPYLAKKYPALVLPSLSTVGNILKRGGYTTKRRRKLAGRDSGPLTPPKHPNHVWTMDFKGWWKTEDDKICEPFTVCDAYSRNILYCEPVKRKNSATIWKILENLFFKYGLPERLRSDNGPPFASIGVGRMTALSINLVQAGVIPERIRAGKPQDNGRHERMHRTMNKEVALNPASSISKQAEQLKEFQNYYNNIRPHEALENLTPSQVYVPSQRAWDGIKKSPDYPEGYLLRKVDRKGQISLYGHVPFISERLRGEYIGVREFVKSVYELYYGPIFLGTLDFLNGYKKF